MPIGNKSITEHALPEGEVYVRATSPFANPDVREALVRANRAGMPVKAQAQLIGVHQDTLYEWCRRGAENIRDHEEVDVPLNVYGTFVREWWRARGQAVMEMMETWQAQASNPDRKDAWVAAATYMERNYPEEFSKQTVVKGDNTLIIKVIQTDQWGEVNAATGQVIDSEFKPMEVIES